MQQKLGSISSFLQDGAYLRRLYANVRKCTGCRICELVCSLRSEKKFSPRKSRIRVSSVWPYPGLDVPVFCRQCDNPPCVKNCPTDSLTRDSVSGILLLNEEKCIGCRLCVEACPIGAIYVHSDKNIPVYCDLCGGDPRCAKYCPTNALEFKAANEFSQARRNTFAKATAASSESREELI